MGRDYRQATAADAERIALLHADSRRRHLRGIYPDSYLDHEVVADRLSDWGERLGSPAPNRFVLLAEEGSDLIGFASAVGEADSTWGTLLDNIHVRFDAQRRGVGTALMRAAARWSKDRYPSSPLNLWVREDNHDARRFYERLAGVAAERTIEQLAGDVKVWSLRIVWPDPGTLADGVVPSNAEE